MRLASEAISVPRPPKLTPVKSAGISREKSASRMAAGTLLMTWLVRMPAHSSRPLTSAVKSASTAGMRFKFPIKMKKHRKVSSKK